MATTRQTSVDVQWDEDRGGPRDPCNYMSIPTDSEFYRITSLVLPWRQSDHDGQAHQLVPGAYIENLLRKLTVQDTTHLKTHHFNTKCLALSKVNEDRAGPTFGAESPGGHGREG